MRQKKSQLTSLGTRIFGEPNEKTKMFHISTTIASITRTSANEKIQRGTEHNFKSNVSPFAPGAKIRKWDGFFLGNGLTDRQSDRF